MCIHLQGFHPDLLLKDGALINVLRLRKVEGVMNACQILFSVTFNIVHSFLEI